MHFDIHDACLMRKVLRLCNQLAPPEIDPVRRWLQARQQTLVSVVSVRRGATGFGIVMNDDACVCGGPGHTCNAIPLGATVVQVGKSRVRNKAEVVESIRSIPTSAEVQFTYRHTASAAAQEEQLHGVLQALRAAEVPARTWLTELAGALVTPPGQNFSVSVFRSLPTLFLSCETCSSHAGSYTQLWKRMGLLSPF